LPLLVLYDSARATYRLAALLHVLPNAEHVVTAAPLVAYPGAVDAGIVMPPPPPPPPGGMGCAAASADSSASANAACEAAGRHGGGGSASVVRPTQSRQRWRGMAGASCAQARGPTACTRLEQRALRTHRGHA
jgi:hypothetical protein